MRLPAGESLSLWERWHCEAMTERASPFPKSICTAISIGFCQSDTIAVSELFVSVLALSVSPRQLPQRGSPWHVGQLSSGRAKHNISEAVVLRCLGQRQRSRRWEPQPGLVERSETERLYEDGPALCSKARPFTPYRASLVQWELDRHARGSPSGRAGAQRLRGRL